MVKDFLRPEAIFVDLQADDKHSALKLLSIRAAELTELNGRDIFEVLLRREALGSTSIGRGVAIPHARLEPVPAPFGLFARLRRPIDFGAADDQAVDLIFLVLVPVGAADTVLSVLASSSRIMRDDKLVQRLRLADHPIQIFDLLTSK